jgi:phthiocerol/phenolphthiocerol synthesis type-I polyketide synthase C
MSPNGPFQLTWEALENAGILPSSISNMEVGVFIGASQTDYGHAFFNDPAIADAYFAPGTALAVLANRISHVYGLNGPSITVDTACSSSLVALHQAVDALRSRGMGLVFEGRADNPGNDLMQIGR